MKYLVIAVLALSSAAEAAIITTLPSFSGPSLNASAGVDYYDEKRKLYRLLDSKRTSVSYPPVLSLSSQSASPDGFSSGASGASVTPGVIKLSAASGVGSYNHGSASASAGGGWTVLLRGADSALQGTKGQMTLNSYFDFTTRNLVAPVPANYLSAGSSATFTSVFTVSTPLTSYQSTYRINRGLNNEINMTETILAENTVRTWGGEETSNNDYTPNRQSLTIDFTWGDLIAVSLDVYVQCGSVILAPANGAFASCMIDASRSSYWDGISGVTSNGVPVDAFTLETSIGADLSKSLVPDSVPPQDGEVPEPGPALLLLAGAFAMKRSRMRRNGKPDRICARRDVGTVAPIIADRSALPS